MLHRMISVFLCSCLLAVNIPQISYAQNMKDQSASGMGYLAHQGDCAVYLSDGGEEKSEEQELELVDDGDGEDNDGSEAILLRIQHQIQIRHQNRRQNRHRNQRRNRHRNRHRNQHRNRHRSRHRNRIHQRKVEKRLQLKKRLRLKKQLQPKKLLRKRNPHHQRNIRRVSHLQ